MKRVILAAAFLLLLLSCAAGAAEAAAPPAGAVEILNAGSYWRNYVTRRPPMVSVAAFKAAGKTATVPKAPPKLLMKYTSPPQPENWAAPGFDDRDWPRSRTGWISQQASARAHSFRISLRGRFEVTNPAGVTGLYLKVKYRGGVVVYLNGKEVARKDMPAGKLAPETSASLYPNDAWVDSRGKALSHRKKHPQRDRALGPVKLPVSALKKGLNVLAVEARRSDFHPVALKWRDFGHPPSYERWMPIALSEVVLLAAGGGAKPNASRPKGLQVWVRDRNDYLTPDDYGDPGEKLQTVKLAGARNGSFCGQLGVGSRRPIKGLKVTAGDFKGPGTIPATNVAVMYAAVGNNRGKWWFDNLLYEAPAEVPVRKFSPGRRMAPAAVGALQPVLFRVKVPKDAKPGDYRGTLTVSAAGARPVTVPVELHVADWHVPDPRDFRTYVDLYQSPTSVALQYKVKMWSEEHWKLLDASWKLLGRAGNKLAIINAAEETQFGNPRGMIYWVKKPDGSYDYDFTHFDRYMKMVMKHCGKLDHVGVQVWHVGNIHKTGSGWGVSKLDQKVTVTLKDPKTGKLESLKVPVFATEEGKKFWKPFLAATDARLAKMGLKGTLCLGILMDALPSPKLFQMFDDIWPGGGPSKWMRGCHVSTSATKPYPCKRGGPGLIVLQEYCYGGGVRNPKFGEARNYPGAYYFRASNEDRVSLSMYLTFADFCLAKGTKGIGRICLDYWPVLANKRNPRWKTTVINRYPNSDCMQRRPTITHMSWPGPKGALPTARLEALIEGVQEGEAVIVVAEALEKHKAGLGTALAEECAKLLKDRDHYRRLAWSQYENRSYGWPVLHPQHYGWQELSKRLFTCAGKVSKKLGK